MSFKLDSRYLPPTQQADAVISQADPVSDTLYTVLDTTANVQIESISCQVTWGVTQPTDLRVVVTVDGITKTFYSANPISATPYELKITPEAASTTGTLIAGSANSTASQLQVLPTISGRSVKVEIGITWAVTQPTPLVCRVKYAKW